MLLLEHNVSSWERASERSATSQYRCLLSELPEGDKLSCLRDPSDLYTSLDYRQMQCWRGQSSEDASSRKMPVSNEGGATLGRAEPRPGLALYIDCVRAPGGICSPAAEGFEDCIRLYCGSSIRVLPFSRSTLSTL